MENNGRDPVMAAVSDEPLPEGADRDPEVAAALADVAVLREQLALIGETVAADTPAEPAGTPARPADAPAGEPADAPAPVVTWAAGGRRRRRVLALTLAASVVVAAVGVGAAYLAAHNGDIDGVEESAKLTPAGVVACSTDVAEGTVARVQPLSTAGEYRVELRVERTYKPENGPRSLTFEAPDPDAGAAEPYFRVGERMLVVLSRFPDEPALTFRQGAAPPEFGEEVGEVRDELEYGRKWVEKAMPGAIGAECFDRG